jgi:hypothetical protein
MNIASKSTFRKLVVTLLAALGTASGALAQTESASGTVSGVLNGSLYDYIITLNNTSGSVSIGSFWYSWTPTIPPFFYLPGVPSSAGAPAGWNAVVDGNSIQYSATLPANALAPGQSIQFSYVAAFPPASLTGLTGDSWVYSGAIFGDPGAMVTIQTVAAPEPSSLGLLAAGFLGLVFAGRRKETPFATSAPVRWRSGPNLR